MTKQERLTKRNQLVRSFFSKLEEKHPEWRYDALVSKTAEAFLPLSNTTIMAIIQRKAPYQN